MRCAISRYTQSADSIGDTITLAMDSRLASVWTAMPGIIESFNESAMTAKVKPAIKAYIEAIGGEIKEVELPLLLDVPIVFQGGGGFSFTFPIKQGDECLVVFSCRCIDGWWQSGGVQSSLEARMHDLSDAFAIVGVRSQPNTLNEAGRPVDVEKVELRKDDGSAYIRMDAEGSFEVEGNNLTGILHGEQNVTIEGASTITIKGNANINVDGSTKLTCKDVEIGKGEMQAVIQSTRFKEYFDTHVHTGNLGAPTSPPQMPLPKDTFSQQVKTGG